MTFRMNRPIIKGTKQHKASIAKARVPKIEVEQTRTQSDPTLVEAGRRLGESLMPHEIDFTQPGLNIVWPGEKEKEPEPPPTKEEKEKIKKNREENREIFRRIKRSKIKEKRSKIKETKDKEEGRKDRRREKRESGINNRKKEETKLKNTV